MARRTVRGLKTVDEKTFGLAENLLTQQKTPTKPFFSASDICYVLIVKNESTT